jgi:PRC-barrel domain
MLKPIVLAAFLSGAAIAAYAQTAPTQPSSPSPSAPVSPAAPAREAASVERMVSTGDFNVSGDMGASALIGTKVRNASKESIGKIDEIYLDKDAKVTVVVISVGGFLGVGSKDVGVKWSDLTFGKEDTSLVVTTSLSKDALMALPDYTKSARRKPAPPETATAPPARPATPGTTR